MEMSPGFTKTTHKKDLTKNAYNKSEKNYWLKTFIKWVFLVLRVPLYNIPHPANPIMIDTRMLDNNGYQLLFVINLFIYL